jgi:glutamate racemase
VPLIEEGWVDHPVTRDVLRIYLREALDLGSPQVVILGCTHYPLIAPLVAQTLKELGSNAEVIDSARATALDVAHSFKPAVQRSASTAHATFECFATDSVEKFARLGSQFLGQPIPRVEPLDLGG